LLSSRSFWSKAPCSCLLKEAAAEAAEAEEEGAEAEAGAGAAAEAAAPEWDVETEVMLTRIFKNV
jgi:hypothetical protein